MLKSLLLSPAVADIQQDPFYDDTVLWLRGDSLSNGNFVDSSKYAHTVTSGTGTAPSFNIRQRVVSKNVPKLAYVACRGL